MKRIADEHGVEGERKTTGTVSENRIRGEAGNGRTRPGEGRRGWRVSSFSTPVLPRTARRYTYTLGVYILYPVYPSCR